MISNWLSRFDYCRNLSEVGDFTCGIRIDWKFTTASNVVQSFGRRVV